MEERWLIVALVLSVLFNVVVFFKDFFNKFLFRNIESKEEKDKEKREILKKFRNLLNEYAGSSQAVALYSSIYFRGSDVDGKRMIEPYYKEANEKYGLLNKALLEIKPDLEKSVRERLDAVMMKANKNILIAVGGEKYVAGLQALSQDDFIREMVNIQQECFAFAKSIEEQINV